MKIAFCDDDPEFIKNYDMSADEINEIVPVNYDNYISGNDLIKDYDKHDSYDIVFLDIELGKDSINGIETANKLKEMDDNVLIVFCTSHTEYVYESFEVEPFRFIVKPFDSEKFKDVMLVAYKEIQKINSDLCLVSDEESQHISVNDIYYIESDKRALIFHFKENSIISNGKLDDYSQKLYVNDFVLVNKSCLVNFNHIAVLESESIRLKNDSIIPISRNKHKYAKEEHVKFVLRRFGTNEK